jgi:4-amino-4-deoxy-L-arabinose transferase-like glycosyltransferase
MFGVPEKLKFKEHGIYHVGYFLVFIFYFLTHFISLVEYPIFSPDEMFYALKAVCWEQYEIPSVYAWNGMIWPEFTNPPALPWILMLLFRLLGTKPVVLRGFIFVIGVANLILIFLIGQELGKEVSPRCGYILGIIAGMILAFDPGLVKYSRIGLLDNPMNLCLTLFLYFYLKYLTTEDFLYAWLAGSAVGLGLWFKLSSIFVLVGLGIYSIMTREIDGPLRVQAMIFLFLGLYIYWGISVDPLAFVNGTIFQITKEYAANPIQFWMNVVFTDGLRVLILLSAIIPFLYWRYQTNTFYKSSFFVFCLFLGAFLFFFFTTSLYDYYFAGFASIYAILYAIGVYIAGQLLYPIISQKIERAAFLINSNIASISPRNARIVTRIVLIFVCVIPLVLQHSQTMKLIESRDPRRYWNDENHEYLKITSFIKENIPKGSHLVVPIQIGAWLNASGYSVWTTWLNSSTPDWIVREYVENEIPDFVVLQEEYLFITEGLEYADFKIFPNYTILEQIAN